MMHTATPDLDNDPAVLYAIAAVLWATLVIVACVIYRRNDREGITDGHRRPHARATRADHGERIAVPEVGRSQPRAARPSAARMDRDVHRDRRSSNAGQRDRGASDAGERSRLELSDDELVALARYLDRSGRMSAQPFPPAAVKVLHAAAGVLNTDRAARR